MGNVFLGMVGLRTVRTSQVREKPIFTTFHVRDPFSQPVGTPIYVPQYWVDLIGVDLFFDNAFWISTVATFMRMPEPCYSMTLKIGCATILRPCMILSNGKLNSLIYFLC